MENITNETNTNTGLITVNKLIYYLLGVVEVLLGFRFVFRLLGANPDNPFVSFLYSLSGIFIAPFQGIFSEFATDGLEARSVLEPQTLVAMVVYAVIAVGIVRLIEMKTGKTPT